MSSTVTDTTGNVPAAALEPWRGLTTADLSAVRGTVLEYLLVFFFIGISAMPIFQRPEYLIVYVTGIVLYALFRKPSALLPKSFAVWGLFWAFLLIYGIHFATLNCFMFSYPVHFAKFYIAFLIVNLLRERFVAIFLRWMFFFVIVSLLFECLFIILPGAYDQLLAIGFSVEWSEAREGYSSLVIYHLLPSYLQLYPVRNPGPFWEPGAFAGFLIITYFIRFCIDRKLWSKYNILMTLALLTTFSTAGYCVFMVLLIGIYGLYYKKYLIVVVALIVACTLFFSVDFLGEKLKREKEQTEDFGTDVYRSRYASFLLDTDTFLRYPIAGSGFSEERHDESYGAIQGSCSGATDFLARFGLIGFLLFHILLYFSFAKLGQSWVLGCLGVAAVIGIGLSQVFYYLPLTFSWIFLFLITAKGGNLNQDAVEEASENVSS